MLNRNGLFDIALDAEQLTIFNKYISLCLARLRVRQTNLSVEECDEPSNPPMETQIEAFILPRKPKLAARSSIPSRLFAHGIKFLSLTSLVNTVSGKPNVYLIAGGVPKNETSNCAYYKWLGCVEAFIANETHVLSRFMVSSTTLFNDTTSAAANYLGDKVTAAADPLVNILHTMLIYFPTWPNETRACRHTAGDADLDAAIIGNATAVGEQACYYFNTKTIDLAKTYLLDYVGAKAVADALPESIPHTKIALIMVGVALVVTLGLSGAMGYMKSQITYFEEMLRGRLSDADQDERFARMDSDEKENKEEKKAEIDIKDQKDDEIDDEIEAEIEDEIQVEIEDEIQAEIEDEVQAEIEDSEEDEEEKKVNSDEDERRASPSFRRLM